MIMQIVASKPIRANTILSTQMLERRARETPVNQIVEITNRAAFFDQEKALNGGPTRFEDKKGHRRGLSPQSAAPPKPHLSQFGRGRVFGLKAAPVPYFFIFGDNKF